MIISKLIGGLGNQMFQYAAGKQLAIWHNTDLKLDISELKIKQEGITPRQFELDLLKTKIEIASDSEIKAFHSRSLNPYYRTIQRKLPFIFSKVYISESGHAYHKEFPSYPANTYLNGFWQSEKYFKEIRHVLLSEFVPALPLDSENQNLASKMSECQSVSIHVRRGDYVNNPNANAFHGVLPLSYYDAAIKLLEEKIKIDALFVFSDDTQWVEQNFKFGLPQTIISHNSGKNSVFDIYLMSQCRHNIMANSSFSWWGSWLNSNPEKIVIAPKKWFKQEQMFWQDIYPANCLVL